MPSLRSRILLASFATVAVAACHSSDAASPAVVPPIDTTRLAAPASCPASTFATAPAALDVATATTMQTLGGCAPRSRYTAEIAVRGTIAYTTTSSRRVAVGNVIYVWDVSGNTPGLIDSV